MDIKRCFEILELDMGASPDEVRQAYKDIVSVWHPDRFSHNPRLKKKAEGKIKEINAAYDTITKWMSSSSKLDAQNGRKGGSERGNQSRLRENREAKRKPMPKQGPAWSSPCGLICRSDFET